MDQALFEFKINIVGCDLDDFVRILEAHGYEDQAEQVEKQIEEQLANF